MTDQHHDNEGEEGGDVTGAHTITDEHMAMLTSSAITSDVVISAGIYSVTKAADVPEVFREWPGRQSAPGLVFPWRGMTDNQVLQLRPNKPVKRSDGTDAKYVFPKGVELTLGVHPLMSELVRNPDIPLVITEGTKQTLAAVSALVGGQDYAVVGIAGCYGWSQHQEQIPDLKELAHVLRGRAVYTIFDADWSTNRNVWQAAKGLTEQLSLHGVAEVRYVTVPGGRSTGLDDALATTVDPVEAIRGLLGAAGKTLGRRPRKSQASAYFDEDGSLLTERAAEALLKDYPAALALDGSVAIYESGRYVIDHHHHAVFSAVGDLLGDKYRGTLRSTLHEFVQGRLHADRRRLTDRPRSRWLNLTNGMLDLDSLELHPHDPEHLSSVQLPVDWDPEAECPTYEQWIVQVAGAEQTELLEEMASLMFDPWVTPSKSLFLFGPSRSGKSTFLRLLKAVMGDENTASVTLHALSDDRFASANLYGKKLNVAADLSSAHVQDLSTWKMLTGEDPVTANRKHGSQFSFVNQALFAFSANEPPTVGESSRAYLARIIPVKFGSSFEGSEDPTLEARILHSELPGVLRRWVLARRRWQLRGSPLAASAAVMAEFEVASDRVAMWLDDEMTVVSHVPGPDGAPLAVSKGQVLPTELGLTKTELYDLFKQWAEENSYGKLGRNKFLDRLSRQNGVVEIRVGKGSKNKRAINVIKKSEDDTSPVGSVGNFEPIADIGVAEEGGQDGVGGLSNPHGGSGSEVANTANALGAGDQSSDHAPSNTDSDPDTRSTVTADVDDLTVWVFDAVAADPLAATEGKVRTALRISQTEFHAARDWLIANGVLAKRRGRGFDVLADLVQMPTPYTPMSDSHFVNRPGSTVSIRELLTLIPRPCPECGELEDGESAYFPFCSTHREEISA